MKEEGTLQAGRVKASANALRWKGFVFSKKWQERTKLLHNDLKTVVEELVREGLESNSNSLDVIPTVLKAIWDVFIRAWHDLIKKDTLVTVYRIILE